MARDSYFVGLDVGSSVIKAVVAVKREDQAMPDIIGVGTHASNGMRKGMIVDTEETVGSITAAIEAAEYMAGEPIDHAYISIGGSHLAVSPAKGVIAVSGKNSEITATDVSRALEVAQNQPMSGSREVLRVIPHSFTVDDQQHIKDPVGMRGIRLEANAHIVSSTGNVINNLTRCVHQAGIDIDDLVPVFLASSESILSKRQKELGVVHIDIGGGSTTVSVYEEGSLLLSKVLPIGAGHITNDLAIGLRTSIDVAEKIKVDYGSCLMSDVMDDEKIDISEIAKMDDIIISRKQVVQIIEARMYEILSMVYEELQSIHRAGMLPAGAILTGGGAKLSGLVSFAKDTLGLPVQIGYPVEFGGLKDRIDDPRYATVTGLLLWAMKSGKRSMFSNLSFGGIADSFKGLLKSFMP